MYNLLNQKYIFLFPLRVFKEKENKTKQNKREEKTREDNNKVNARALIGQSVIVYCAGKCLVGYLSPHIRHAFVE